MQVVDAGKGGSRLGFVWGVISAFLLSFILLIAGAFIALYADPGYYEREYLKYDVLSALPVEMTMSSEDGVMAVSNHMMDYLLHGSEPEDLQIEVMMDGKMQPFFSERELSHMWDVRVLFRNFIIATIILLVVWILGTTGALFCLRKNLNKFLSDYGKGILTGLAFLIVACLVLILIVSRDFDAAFVTFHHIFFDNDLWLLDPNQDMMINILPESFFADTAIRIAITFGVLMAALILAAVLMIANSKARMGKETKGSGDACEGEK